MKRYSNLGSSKLQQPAYVHLATLIKPCKLNDVQKSASISASGDESQVFQYWLNPVSQQESLNDAMQIYICPQFLLVISYQAIFLVAVVVPDQLASKGLRPS